ncbi:MAG TPA: HD domain-containing protein [Candidatus Nanopelagicales bacterium]
MRERLGLVPAILATHRDLLAGQARIVAGRRGRLGGELAIVPPDSRLTRAAQAACADVLPASLVAHSARTWWYGQLLARLDGVAVDPELALVAALLHDLGLAAAVPGEDFTLRGARRAQQLLEEAGATPGDALAAADAIAVHTLPGVQQARDGPLGTYLQAGAMLDLIGLRADELSRSAVAAPLAQHPRGDLTDRLAACVRAEAHAVPAGRFALIRWSGFVPAVRLARR